MVDILNTDSRLGELDEFRTIRRWPSVDWSNRSYDKQSGSIYYVPYEPYFVVLPVGTDTGVLHITIIHETPQEVIDPEEE